MTDFRNSYPIDFELYDKDTQNVLYIEDTSDQTLTLEITNASTQTIALENLGGDVSSTNYHFALRFRPGTLSPASLGEDVNSPEIQLAANTATNWEMLLSPADPSGMDVIYIKSSTTDLSMDPDASQTIVFNYVGADAGQGARGTRVELLYTNMTYSGETEIISSNREIHLSVINHRGKQNIPLHVGFVGDNGVINDSSAENELILRFSNTLVYDATNSDLSDLTFSYNAEETSRSKIILSFDVGTSSGFDDWALGDSDDIAGIEITQTGTEWVITAPAQGETPEWIIYPNGADKVLYGRSHPDPNDADAFLDDYFDLNITKLTTAFPAGHTHLHIQYENIPGYWDGQMKVVIEKRGLIYHRDKVGIRTLEPEGELDIHGDLTFNGQTERKIYGDIRQGHETIVLGGFWGATPEEIEIRGSAIEWTEGRDLYIGYDNDHYSIADNLGKIRIGGNTDGTVFYTGDYDVRLRIDNEGHVMIGDGYGDYPLHVRKDTGNGNDRLAYFECSNDNGVDASIAIKAARDNSTTTASFIDLDIYDHNEAGGTTMTMARIGAGKESTEGINGQLRLFTNNNGTLNEALRIDQNGNVGIGTTDPDATLDVAGAIKYTGNYEGTILFGNTNESGTPNGDGFRMRYENHYFGTNDDALIFEKTDGNGSNPDGGIVFANTGNDGVVEEALVIRGTNTVAAKGTLFFGPNSEWQLDEDSWQDANIMYSGAENDVSFGLHGYGGSKQVHLHLDGTPYSHAGHSFWSLWSDERLKQDINPFTDSLEQLKKVKPVWYRYNGKAGTKNTDKNVGIIAQELREVFPYMVSTYNARLNETDQEDTELLNFNGSAMSFVMINAIKELDAISTKQDKLIKKQDKLIKDLVTRIEALEAKLG
ncbi:MAG: tail fiber domain-containing protein [Bacteroidota bacterium]